MPPAVPSTGLPAPSGAVNGLRLMQVAAPGPIVAATMILGSLFLTLLYPPKVPAPRFGGTSISG